MVGTEWETNELELVVAVKVLIVVLSFLLSLIASTY